MDRRQFIGGFGGLAAASALPTLADTPSVFPVRGRCARLSLTYRRVRIGLEKPFSILHVSDTHLTAAYEREGIDKMAAAARRTCTFGGRQEEALRDSLAWAKRNVDYVLHTGDLMDFQSEANFDLVKKYAGETLFGTVGNHEFYTYLPNETHTWQEEFKDRSWPLLEKYPLAARFSSQVINGVNFVCLDDVFGRVVPSQVERFQAEVKKGLPIVLCMHVPFFTDDLWTMHWQYWQSDAKFVSAAVPEPSGDLKRQREDKTTSAFIASLKSERLLKAILAGHEHVSMEDRFSETAMEYCVGGNFLFHGAAVLFS